LILIISSLLLFLIWSINGVINYYYRFNCFILFSMKKLFLFLFVCVSVYGSSLDENLILHLDMDFMDNEKTLIDSSVYKSDSFGHGDVSLVADRHDINSSAIKFGGFNSYITAFIPSQKIEKEATISFWSKILSIESSPLFYLGQDSFWGAVSLYLDDSALYLNKGNNQGLGAGWHSALNDYSNWNFYTLSFAERKTSIYVNGVLQDIFYSHNPANLYNPNILYIGFSPVINEKSSKFSCFNGFMDDFRIYNKSLDSLDVIELLSSYTNLIDINDEKLSFSELLEKVANLEDSLMRAKAQNYRNVDIIKFYKEEVSTLTNVANTPFVNGWIYDEKHGWLFTTQEFYPLIYSNKHSSWFYYELGSHSPRMFYSYKTKEWENWDD